MYEKLMSRDDFIKYMKKQKVVRPSSEDHLWDTSKLNAFYFIYENKFWWFPFDFDMCDNWVSLRWQIRVEIPHFFEWESYEILLENNFIPERKSYDDLYDKILGYQTKAEEILNKFKLKWLFK